MVESIGVFLRRNFEGNLSDFPWKLEGFLVENSSRNPLQIPQKIPPKKSIKNQKAKKE
jgi:hypothetical protein